MYGGVLLLCNYQWHLMVDICVVSSEYRDAFKLFDKDNRDRISTVELSTVLGSLGQDTSSELAKELLATYDPDSEYQL